MADAVYSLGSGEAERQRLEHQAQLLERPTRLLLGMAGLRPGMHVLELGTGLGHVATLLSAMVGSDGAVTALDSSEALLSQARRRAADHDAENIAFVLGDAATWTGDQPFDAVVTRLLLLHLPEREQALRRWKQHLNPTGRIVAIDFDIIAARSEPLTPHMRQVKEWVVEAFRSAGADPAIGARLQQLLHATGYHNVEGLGVQAYLPPEPAAAIIAGIVRSLAPTIVTHNIATEAELELDTLAQRTQTDLANAEAVFLPSTLVGAWADA